jgi:hypothetical protein
LLDQKLQRLKAPAAGGNLEHAGFLAVLENGPDIQALKEARRAMSAASSSIEILDLTRRTLD